MATPAPLRFVIKAYASVRITSNFHGYMHPPHCVLLRAMAESDLFTGVTKGIQKKIRAELRSDEGRASSSHAGSSEGSGSNEEEQAVKKLMLFSDVMEDYQRLIKQNIGIEDRELSEVFVLLPMVYASI